ncbi:transposase, partial [Achromatium sp. WMS1]
LEDYRKRWSIETLFSALKICGFNLEDTHLTQPGRISKLFAIVTIVWDYGNRG